IIGTYKPKIMGKLIYGLQLTLLWGFIFAACSKDLTNSSTTGEQLSVPTELQSSATIAGSGGYVMMTFNIRQDAPDAGNRAWAVRRSLVKERILEHDCDIVGVQE